MPRSEEITIPSRVVLLLRRFGFIGGSEFSLFFRVNWNRHFSNKNSHINYEQFLVHTKPVLPVHLNSLLFYFLYKFFLVKKFVSSFPDVVEDLIIFFVQCFDTLQHQMGYNTCCDIIETLLEFLRGFPFNQSSEFNNFIEGRGSAILDL